MGDFLKSAMNYLNTNAIDSTNNDFVGQVVEVGALKLRVKRVIAEGQYKSIGSQFNACIFARCFHCQDAFCLTHIRNNEKETQKVISFRMFHFNDSLSLLYLSHIFKATKPSK